MNELTTRIAAAIGAQPAQVAAAVRLLDEGATVPFIARYRKEATGNLDDTQLRRLEEHLQYGRELQARRETVLGSIREQGKLSPALEAQILAADTKTRLEDLYLPFKPKRRTKAQIAREQGLEPLADALLAHPERQPDTQAGAFVNGDKGVADIAAALEGARQILMERFAEDAQLKGELRERVWDKAVIQASLVAGQAETGAKFSDYFDHREPLAKVPSHRALALFRGRNEGVLTLTLVLDADEEARCQGLIAQRAGVAAKGRAGDAWLIDTVRWCWKVKLFSHLDLELKQRLRERAESEAIAVFGNNLKDLLLAAPAGGKPVMGLDPGLRTGVKVACVDTTGKLTATATVYPHAPHKRWDETIATLARLCKEHGIALIAIGNGTASRETDGLAADLAKRHPELGLTRAMVSEAGASVYSASELAAQEFPDLDVSLRGAVSIARRLQDPLAELVKIDPKAIGVGQYQHDVSQTQLARTLDAVVEDCVNAVGVDVNMASAALLARVSGLGPTLARAIVEHRDRYGAFADRGALRKVPRLGDKTFEQAAGFLRVPDGTNPLDRSAVHPEAYPVVQRMLKAASRSLAQVMGDADFLRKLDPRQFTDDRFGLETVKDILSELEKPGRDPRPGFRTAQFADGVNTLADLKPGMRLEGVVTNVTNFGAFVDIGVHQDGLVHVSELADRFVRDPREVVRAGQVVQVRVLEVDLKRKRAGLSMKSDDGSAGSRSPAPRRDEGARGTARPAKSPGPPPQPAAGALAEALAKARSKGS